MSERDIALIDELRTTENALVEFKKDNIDPKLIAKLCSALSNAARIEEKDFAYVMWGIDDATHEVVGTRFNPDDVKAGSNMVLQLWLAQHLKPSIAFEFRRVTHPDGAVVLLEIPVANIAPGERLGIEKSNYPQASTVINAAMKEGLIKLAEPDKPRAGYIPWWA